MRLLLQVVPATWEGFFVVVFVSDAGSLDSDSTIRLLCSFRLLLHLITFSLDFLSSWNRVGMMLVAFVSL